MYFEFLASTWPLNKIHFFACRSAEEESLVPAVMVVAAVLRHYPKRYKNTCVTTRGGMVALLWSVAVNTLGVGAVLLFTTMQPFVNNTHFFTAASSYYMVALLLYPVAALVSELRWTRFKSLFVASVIVGIGVPFVIFLVFVLVFDWNF